MSGILTKLGLRGKAGGTDFTPRSNIPRSDVQGAVEYVMDNAENVGTVYAPTDAQYLTSASASGLSNERVVGDSATIVWDFTGLGTATAALQHLGIEDLADPNADRGMFWDDSAGAMAWFEPSSGLAFVGTYLSITDPDLTSIINEANFAEGDILYHNGTVLTRLAKGAYADYLRISAGGIPEWQAFPTGTGLGDLLSTNNLSELTDFPQARINLGVEIGADVQAWDANLDQIAALTPTDGNVIVGNGTAWVAESGATARASLDVYSVSETDAAIAAAVTAEDLDIAGDTGTGAIDLDSETLTFSGGTGVATTVSGNSVTFDTVDSEIVHDNLSGFVADEHVAHSGVTLTAGAGLTGGGDISASRSFAVGAGTGITVNADDVAVDTTVIASLATLAATTTGNGASLIGIEDAGGLITATTVEGALAENRTAIDAIEADYLTSSAIGVSLQAYDADLSAVAGLSSTGMIARTGSGTAAVRTITGPAAGITVTNGNGVSGNPTLALANDLAALEGLGSTGIAARTAANTWAQRTITGTSNEISVTNGDGVSGNPTLSLPSTLTLTGRTITADTQTALDNSTKLATTAYVDNAAPEKLTANRTYYVRTDGSDSNTGLANTSGGAFLTVTKAASVVAGLNAGSYDVTISVGSGTFAESIILPRVNGSGTCTLSGAGKTSTIFTAVTLNFYSAWSVTGFGMNGTANQLQCRAYSACTVTSTDLQFNAATGFAHIYVRNRAQFNATAGYTIAGGAAIHWRNDEGGTIFTYGATITLTGTPAFSSYFAYFYYFANGIIGGMTFSGSATGTRYICAAQSLLATNGGGTSYLPGNAAGTTDTTSGAIYT